MLACVSVRVPATTSNLGPGFDCLGMALSLHNELTLELREGAGEPEIVIEGEGADTLPRTRENLVFKAANAVFAGRAPGRLALRCVNRIPLGRGLGSSGAAAVAGALAANHLLGKPALSAAELIEYATTLEGHPDNAAPAVLGGLVACVRRQKSLATYPLKAHPDLRAVVCIPDFQLATEKARAVLPASYLRADAVDNVARALVLGSALEQGHWDRLAAAMEDRFHQPYRAPLVKGLSSVIKAALAAGAAGACLSGAGPTMLALAPASADLEKIGEAMKEAFAKNDIQSKSLALTVAHGASVVDVSKGKTS